MNNKTVLDNEASYFDEINRARDGVNVLYPQIDCMTKDLYLPNNPEEFPCDPYVARRFVSLQQKAFKAIQMKKAGTSIDVCCGPGWFALQQARFGYSVDGVDISTMAIRIATSYRDLQPPELAQRLNYTCCTIESFLDSNPDKRFDLVTGWSAFHHLLNINESLDQLLKHSNYGAIFISYDDLEYDLLTQLLRKILLFLLPIRGHTYRQKLMLLFSFNRFLKLINTNSVDSPAEIAADKYHDGATQIYNFFSENLTDISVCYQGGFAEAVSYRLNIRNNSLRSIVALLLAQSERFLLSISVISPRYRLITGIHK
jgi:ubiquinone/menaquinone biosynthesis C-methylase UbiE